MEKLFFSKKEKEHKKFLKNSGIKDVGPLSPQYVKDIHDNQVGYAEALGRIADSADQSLGQYGDPGTREYVAEQADEYRHRSREVGKSALEATKDYVGKKRVAGA